MVERTTYRKCLKVGYIKSIVNPAVLQKDKKLANGKRYRLVLQNDTDSLVNNLAAQQFLHIILNLWLMISVSFFLNIQFM
jgi:hypothetical protein